MLSFDLREPVSAWSHCAGLLLALPGTFVLWRRSSGCPPAAAVSSSRMFRMVRYSSGTVSVRNASHPRCHDARTGSLKSAGRACVRMDDVPASA